MLQRLEFVVQPPLHSFEEVGHLLRLLLLLLVHGLQPADLLLVLLDLLLPLLNPLLKISLVFPDLTVLDVELPDNAQLFPEQRAQLALHSFVETDFLIQPLLRLPKFC